MPRRIAFRLVLATVMIAAFRGAFARAADQCTDNRGLPFAEQEIDQAADASNAVPTTNGKVGYFVQLARPGTPAANLALDWNFTQEPDGSQSQIFESGTRNAYFIPDEQGIYMVEGRGNQDTVSETITVGPDRTLIPVEVRRLIGDRYNIVVGGQPYAGPFRFDSAGTNVVLLNRTTLEVVDHKTFTTNPLKDYLQNVLNNNSDVLAIISTNDRGPGFTLDRIAPELERFGANHDFRTKAAVPFAFIGIKNSKSGQAYQVGFSSVNLIGYLAPDASSKYAFIQTDYKTFEIKPSTNLSDPSTVKIEGRTVLSSSAGGCAGGGLLLGILDRASLQPIITQSYCTLAATPQASIAAQKALSDKLNAEARPGSPVSGAAHRGDLVFLVGFGQIHNGASPGAPDFSRLAYYINFAGGTYEAIYNVNSGDTYSLITSPDPNFTPSEAGTQIEQGSSAHQEGVLARGHLGNWYAPTGSTTKLTNFGLEQILAQPPRDFPLPAPGNDQQKAYLDCISQFLCGACTSVRTTYQNLNIDLGISFTRLSNKIVDPLDQSNPSCMGNPVPDTPWCQVRQQVLTELEYAAHIRKLFSNVQNLWTAQNSNISLSIINVTSTVSNAVKLDAKKMVHPLIEGLIGGFLSAVRVIPPPTGQVLGVIHGLFTAAVGIANDQLGNNSSLDVDVKAGELAAQAKDNFIMQQTATGVIFDSIYEDWGKLQALGTVLKSGDEKWKWKGDTTGQLLHGFDIATEQAAYRSLMNGRFWTRYYNAQVPSDTVPWSYEYKSCVRGPLVDIFSGGTPSVVYLSSSSPRSGYRDILTMSHSGGLPSGPRTQYNTPSADLIQHLLAPVVNKGLGLWKPEIIRHWLPIRWCGPPKDFYTGSPFICDGSSGCDSSTIRLPLLNLGALTTMSLSSSLNPSEVGGSVTFTAQVMSEDGNPVTGRVQLIVNGQFLRSVDLINGQAAITATLPVGDDVIVATYLGDVNNAGVNSMPLIETVKAD